MDQNKWLAKYRKAKYCLLAQFFLSGTEFSIILPTLEPYLKEIQTKRVQLFFGIIFASYYVSGSILATVLGRILDRTLKFCRIMMLINAITAAGSLLYSSGYSPYLILLGRFLGGAADSIFAVTYGELSRCFPYKEFSRQAEHLMISFSIGFCVGPALNTIPTNVEWNIKFMTIRYTNAPGVLLFVGNTVLGILTYIFICDLSSEKQNILSEQLTEEKENDNIAEQTSYQFHQGINDENFSIEYNFPNRNKPNRVRDPWYKVLKEFLGQTDVDILIYGNIVWSYTTITNGALLPLVAENIIGLSMRSLSFMYMGSGFILVVLLCLSPLVLKRYNSVTISIAAFITCLVGLSCLSLCILCRDFPKGLPGTLLFVFAICYLLSWCFNSIVLKTLLSQCVALENQSFCQGIFCVVEYSTCIIGGLTSGFLYDIALYYCAWAGVMVTGAIFAFSYHYQLLGYR